MKSKAQIEQRISYLDMEYQVYNPEPGKRWTGWRTIDVERIFYTQLYKSWGLLDIKNPIAKSLEIGKLPLR